MIHKIYSFRIYLNPAEMNIFSKTVGYSFL